MAKYVLHLGIVAAVVLAAGASAFNASCYVSSFDDVASAVANCTAITLESFTVPAGKTLLMKLKNGTTVNVTGNITFGHSDWKGPLVQIAGSNITFESSGGIFDGEGSYYWDGKGDLGRIKPKFFKIKTTGASTFSNIKLNNCPRQCVSINSASDTTLDGWTIDVSDGDSAGGKNTDGFDLSSSHDITIMNSVVMNQDDCVAINQGYNYVFKNLTCSGGHGLSLSVGQSNDSGSVNTVSNVTFSNCTVINSRNGIHVKTHSNAGNGSITDITYENITLSGITHYGINVQQDYEGGKSTGKPNDNIPITNLNLNSVNGTMMSEGSSSVHVYILCGTNGCSSWPWSEVSIAGAKKPNSCNFNPSGFDC